MTISLAPTLGYRLPAQQKAGMTCVHINYKNKSTTTRTANCLVRLFPLFCCPFNLLSLSLLKLRRHDTNYTKITRL